jgi:colicin import membrane protein
MREQQTMADTRTDAQKAAEAKADADKAAADKAAADKLAADRAAAEKAVREAKTPAEKAVAEKALDQVAEREDAQKQRKSTRSGPLARAGESGDPDVHRLLAERQAHVSNAGLEPDPAQEAVRKAARDAIDAIDDQLAELGYTAK